MKADGSLRSLLQGVSQQPVRQRLPGQATLQENMSSDPITGLTRRPPTDLVGLIGTSSNVRGWHHFQTQDGNKFIAMFYDDKVRIVDLNAVNKTVTIDANTTAYMSVPNGQIRCQTNNQDETVVVNTAASPAIQSSPVAYFNTPTQYYGIVQVLGGQYGKSISIFINGALVSSFRSPDGTNASDSVFIATKYIASQLKFGADQTTAGSSTPAGGSSLLTWTGVFDPGAGWSYTLFEDLILVSAPTGVAFTITVTDDIGNKNAKACTSVIENVADLPRTAPHLYVVRVAQQTTPDKDLWFKFIAEDSAGSLTPAASGFGKSGYWQECVATGVDTSFEPTSMPHKITYSGSAFQLSQKVWAARKVGTLISNPNPSFVGSNIRDISSFQGRTVFLAGSNVIMSRNNRPEDFWFGSASALVDTDPIDVNSKIETSMMLAAVQHNRDLVCFTRNGQFIVYGRTALTPNNAALVLTTRFEADLTAKPIVAGRNVFFSADYGGFAGIREFFAEGGTDINDSRPVTQHVKRYIEGTSTQLTGSSIYDALLVHTNSANPRFYVYQYIWSDTEKVQSAWSAWVMNWPIVYSFFDQDVIYFVQQAGTDYFLLRMNMTVQNSAGVGYPVMLDNRFDVPGCNQVFVIPNDYLHDQPTVCVQGLGCPNPGMLATIKSIDRVSTTWHVTLERDMGGGNLIVGTPYMSRYRPTMPVVKDTDGIVVGTGKLRIKEFLVSVAKTGAMIGRLFSKWGNGPEVKFNGRTIGAADDIIGVQSLSDSTLSMPFRADSTEGEVEFYSNSHLPMTLLNIEWKGQYTKKGRRMANGGR